jgi:hypothetical protein
LHCAPEKVNVELSKDINIISPNLSQPKDEVQFFVQKRINIEKPQKPIKEVIQTNLATKAPHHQVPDV